MSKRAQYKQTSWMVRASLDIGDMMSSVSGGNEVKRVASHYDMRSGNEAVEIDLQRRRGHTGVLPPGPAGVGGADVRDGLRGPDGPDGPDEAGDRGTFEQITEHHRPYLLRKAISLSGNPETAKDLVQDTLLRALKSFDKFQQGTNARAWLSQILTRLYLDFLKQQRVASKANMRIAELLESETCEPADDARYDALLAEAVTRLEPKQREVIELCCFREMKYREAAEVLRLPSGTVGTRLKCARERLREILRTMMDEE